MAAKREWSLAGAARAAREARISTVAYLRDAPIAREWELQKLLLAYQLKVMHMRDRAAAAALLFSGLGYTKPPKDWDDLVEWVLADEARYLAEADLYILTPQMCDVVIAAAQTLTIDDLEMVTADDLPSPTGVVVLPYPIIVKTMGGDLADDAAFTWRTPIDLPRPTPEGGWQTAPAVRVSSYHDSYGPVRPDSFLDFAARARAQGTPLPKLLLDAIRCHPFGYAA